MFPLRHATQLSLVTLVGLLLASCGPELSGGEGGPGDGTADELPNLSVGSMMSSPGGAESEGSVEVLNTGEADAGGFEVDFWFEAPAGEVGESGDVSVTVDSLAAGESVWVEATLSGSHCLVSAYIDSQDDVEESDEGDNSDSVDGCGR